MSPWFLFRPPMMFVSPWFLFYVTWIFFFLCLHDFSFKPHLLIFYIAKISVLYDLVSPLFCDPMISVWCLQNFSMSSWITFMLPLFCSCHHGFLFMSLFRTCWSSFWTSSLKVKNTVYTAVELFHEFVEGNLLENRLQIDLKSIYLKR